MNIALEQIIRFEFTWTLFASALFLVSYSATCRTRNAALRHFAWVLAFSGVLLYPVCAAAMAWPSKGPAPLCDPPVANAGFPPIAGLLPLAWGAGFAWSLFRMISGWRRVTKWRDLSSRFPGELLATAEIPSEWLNGAEVRVAARESASLPIVWGARKPSILLPNSSLAWSPVRLHAVLWHEFGHVRRFDNLTQLAALLLCAIHWFNPLFWRAAKRMEAEAEIAADDFAIRHGIKSSTYAAELLDLATQFSVPNPGYAFTPALIKAYTLEERFHSILDPNTRREGISRSAWWQSVSVAVGVILALAFLTPQVNKAFSAKTAPACLSTPS